MASRRIKVRPLNKANVIIQLTLAALVLLSLYSYFTMDGKGVQLGSALLAMLRNFGLMFLEPHARHFTMLEAFKALMVTVGLAFLTTLVGAFVALFLGLFAAANLSNRAVSNAIKGLGAFVRAVPTVLWVLIFAVAAGLGSVAAVIGMAFHSCSYLIKAFSEAFEEMDDGVIEALKSNGAGWWQIVFQSVIPSTVTYLLSWTFLRFEINFGVAVAMGAAAGAGGIGFDMFMASGFYLDLREVGLITYYILAFAILLEMFAVRLKVRLKHD